MTLRHTCGYSLLEVLVALLVLSAGVIGAAGLQVSAWQMAQQSTFHSNAHQLAAEVAEWLQAYRHNLPSSLQNLEIPSASAAPQVASHCYGTFCNVDQFASFMVSDWQTRLHTTLPDARLRICRDEAPWDSAASIYRWTCSASDGEAPLVIKIGWKDAQAREGADAPVVVLNAGL